MQVAIHISFMQAWAKLSQQDRKQVEALISRVQSGSITPGMRPHLISEQNRYASQPIPQHGFAGLGMANR
jgi:mRNA-degrading endonuclease RelE of RelBE toxin-antitoxin system